ncbi:MAG: Gfo/Idh/MocA family protein [Phycisphaerae bacterium]
MNIGIVGCGNISGIYFKNAASLLNNVRVTCCSDLIEERAREVADEQNCRACSTDELLAADDVDIVLNLTIPKAHHEVAMRALQAGKHVYNEKPLAMTRPQAAEMLALAGEKGLRVGCAPDTFLGGGLQTCRALIDAGEIGTPIGAMAFMGCPGHESWHPAPEFYYKPGGGPVLDMGPYYVTALVALLGGVKRVAGLAKEGRSPRVVGSGPLEGQQIDVEVATHVTGVMDFASGAAATLIMSFDVWGHNCPRIEIYGSEGSLSCPDPNTFGGPVKIKRGGDDWEEIQVDRPYTENSRCLGVADMAAAAESGRPHRCSGELAVHVLDIMLALQETGDSGRYATLETGIDRPSPMPADLPEGEVEK